MFILIVAIHSYAFYGGWTSVYLKPITGIAVPVFFILSSFFYFRKIHVHGYSSEALGHFLSRIALLYLFWFIVKLPIIMHEHQYFISGGLTDMVRLLKDVLLRYTFAGSWFLSSLALAVLIVSIAYNNKILRIVVFPLSVLMLFYINCIEITPAQFHGFYRWWQVNVRDEVALTLLEALPWVSLGFLLSTPKLIHFTTSFNKYHFGLLVALTCVVLSLYIVSVNLNLFLLKIIVKIICACSLVILAGASNMNNSCQLTHLRNISILLYMFHFVIINLMGIAGKLARIDICSVIGYFPYFLLIFLFSYLCSETFLWLSTKRYFKLLKFGY